eukprot:4896895-Amphidinium_carterae.2
MEVNTPPSSLGCLDLHVLMKAFKHLACPYWRPSSKQCAATGAWCGANSVNVDVTHETIAGALLCISLASEWRELPPTQSTVAVSTEGRADFDGHCSVDHVHEMRSVLCRPEHSFESTTAVFSEGFHDTVDQERRSACRPEHSYEYTTAVSEGIYDTVVQARRSACRPELSFESTTAVSERLFDTVVQERRSTLCRSEHSLESTAAVSSEGVHDTVVHERRSALCRPEHSFESTTAVSEG